MEPVITPLDDRHEKSRHGWITVAFVMTYLVFAGLAIYALLFLSRQRQDLNSQVVDLKSQLNERTASIRQGEGQLSVEGNLNVNGGAVIGEDLLVHGVGFFDTKVNVGSPLVIRRKAAVDELLLSFKTVDDINWSLGYNPQNKTSDKNNLNLYIGSGLNDPILSVGTNGQFLFRNANNSTSAFAIQNAAKAELFRADTLTGSVIVSGALTAKTLSVGSGSTLSKVLIGTCAINPASIAPGDKLLVNCSAAGVAVSDKVFVDPPTNLNEDLEWQIVGVTGANTIQIRLRNNTLAAIDDSSKNWSWFAIR